MSNLMNAMLGTSKPNVDADDLSSTNPNQPGMPKESVLTNPMKQHQPATSLEAERVRNEGLTYLGDRTDKSKPDNLNSANLTTSSMESSGPDSGFGHIGSRGNTHSGFGSSNQGNDTHSRDTSNFGVVQGYAQSQDKRPEQAFASRLSETTEQSINPTTGQRYGTSGVTIGHYVDPDTIRDSSNTTTTSSNINTSTGSRIGDNTRQESLGSTFAPSTSPESGVGVHARQFSRDTTNVDPGIGKTTYINAAPLVTTTRDRVDVTDRSRNTDLHSKTGRAASGLHDHNVGEHVNRSSDTQNTQQVPQTVSELLPPGPTTMTTTTDTDVKESISPYHLRPGETIVEKETRVHRGIGPTERKAGHTTTSTSNTFEDSSGKPLNKGNLNEMSSAKRTFGGGSTKAGAGGGVTGTGKASMSDKLTGGAEKTAGKLVGNQSAVEHGEATAAGRLNSTKN